MTRATVPTTYPPLPEGASCWSRSTRRVGSVFHAHAFGLTVCRSLLLSRHQSVDARNLGDLQYYGVCPRCFKLASKVPA